MNSGYKILWTEHALSELEKTIDYLKSNFPGKPLERLYKKMESVVSLISKNPDLFSKSDKKGIYKVTILKYNTMYYQIQCESLIILSFFSNRQNLREEYYKSPHWLMFGEAKLYVFVGAQNF